jgi:hypothetical protein
MQPFANHRLGDNLSRAVFLWRVISCSLDVGLAS